MPLRVGQVLKQRYRIVRLLGQGGFGAVYRAWDTLLEHACAVKENLDSSPEAQSQFLIEAKLLAGLAHPNLPRVTDTFFLPGQGQYLVMDYVDGQDLDEMLQAQAGRPLAEGRVLPWAGQVLEALTYLHSQAPPVIHRDIKPANIKITPDGRALLVDFGLAKRYTPGTKTSLGARAVTEGYSPLEQYGKGTTDARSDIYALGATLYHLLTGVEPLESVGRTPRDGLVPAGRANPALSPHVAGAIGRAMEMDPDQRFQSAAAFKAALFPPGAAPPGAATPGATPAGAAQAGGASSPMPLWVAPLVFLVIASLCLGPRIWNALSQLSDRPAALPSPTETYTASPLTTDTIVPTSSPTSTAPPSATLPPSSTWTPAPTQTPTPIPSPSPLPGRLLESAQPGERWTSPVDGAVLVYLPAGDYLMGSPEGSAGAQADEMPQHWVSLGASWIDLSEVTSAMFARFVQATGYVTEAERAGSGSVLTGDTWGVVAGADWRHPLGAGSSLEGLEQHPVTLVSWSDAASYCAWAGRRLPTEAEWEYAGRGALDGALYPWGNADLSGSRANFADASLGTGWADLTINDGWRLSAPVGSYPDGASPFGVLDLAGNVWEWVQDWYDPGAYAAPAAANPGGPAQGSGRILRGGGWSHAWSALRLAARRSDDPAARSADVGFRCLLAVTQ